jgi:ketosteroid isomerase-like protein
MSQENVETVRRWIEAYNRRDMEGLVAVIEPDFEFRSIFVTVESVFRGHERFPHAYFRTLDEAYASFVVTPSELIDLGVAVLMVATADWLGRESGAEGKTPVNTAFWLRGDKVSRAETFTDRDEALEAIRSEPDGPQT